MELTWDGDALTWGAEAVSWEQAPTTPTTLTTFWFLVEAEITTSEPAVGAPNVFPRYTGTAINLDGRDGTIETDPGGTANLYTLEVVVSPLQLEPGGTGSITVKVRKDGLAIVSQSVAIATSNSGVIPVTTPVYTSTIGNATFSFISGSVGSATISASMVIDGVTYTSNVALVTVSTIVPPLDPTYTGYGRVVATVESPLANAMRGRLQRLSHEEQLRKFPDDDGLSFATHFETATITVVPKALQ